VKVRTPDGQTWRVSRRWVPWRRRTKGWVPRALDHVPSFPVTLGDDPVSTVIGAVFLVIALPFLVVALAIGLVALVELAAVLAVLPLALLGRVLLGRHWQVEARRGWQPYWEVEAGSWSASTERIHAVAAAIERGDLPPRTLGLKHS
jgi:hypothetical protein